MLKHELSLIYLQSRKRFSHDSSDVSEGQPGTSVYSFLMYVVLGFDFSVLHVEWTDLLLPGDSYIHFRSYFLWNADHEWDSKYLQ